MRMREYSRAYNKEAMEIAFSRITVQQCQKCGHPTEDGFCCGHCGCASPKHPDQEASDSTIIIYGGGKI